MTLPLIKKLREWNTLDHWIDLIVDVALIVFDILSSPVLILVRIIRNTINRFIKGHIKRFLKYIIHKLITVKT